MPVYRSAMGKSVDMGALSAQNERVRAVGNGKMNARGDVIDSEGRVVKPNTNKVNEIYSKTVTNRSAVPQPTPLQELARQHQRPLTDADMNFLPEEVDMGDTEHDREVERIKAEQTRNESKRSKR